MTKKKKKKKNSKYVKNLFYCLLNYILKMSEDHSGPTLIQASDLHSSYNQIMFGKKEEKKKKSKITLENFCLSK